MVGLLSFGIIYRMKIIILCLSIVAVAAIIYFFVFTPSNTTVKITNKGTFDLTNIKITVGTNTVDIGTLSPYDSKSVALEQKIIGEADVLITYNDGKVWRGGYVEDGYQVHLTFYTDTDIRIEP